MIESPYLAFLSKYRNDSSSVWSDYNNLILITEINDDDTIAFKFMKSKAFGVTIESSINDVSFFEYNLTGILNDI